MSKRKSLRQRITTSYLILTLIICSLFIVIFFIAEQYTKSQVFDKHINDELERLIKNKQSDRIITLEAGMNFYFDDEIPAPFLKLEASPNTYEVVYKNKKLVVMVHIVNGVRYVLTDDQETFETIENMLMVSLVFASIISVFLSLLIARISSNQVIKPLTKLAISVSSGSDKYKYMDESNDEIGALSQAINVRNDKLNRFLIREQLFTGDVSHELRTPLTVILGAAEVLQVQLEKDSHLIEFADRIQKAAIDGSQRMAALLLLSRSPESIDAPATLLRELISYEIEQNAYLLKDKAVTCTFIEGEDVSVYVREELARIAIGNLIRNACQYTEKGEIIINLSQEKLIIEDTGFGIPENIRALLFERFVRGSGNEQPGSGLGLSIVKRVCEHIDWRITYVPRTTGGSKFIIDFNR